MPEEREDSVVDPAVEVHVLFGALNSKLPSAGSSTQAYVLTSQALVDPYGPCKLRTGALGLRGFNSGTPVHVLLHVLHPAAGIVVAPKRTNALQLARTN